MGLYCRRDNSAGGSHRREPGALRTIRRHLPILASVALAGAAATQEAGTLSIASGNRIDTLDPIRSAAAGNREALGQLLARLLRKSPEGELEPGLAESWEASEDGLTYTFELRDARFSNGTPTTAEDAAFSLDRVAEDEVAAYSTVDEVVAVGEDTVELRLAKPSAPILSYMEIFNTGIVSGDDVETRGEEAFAGDPVASGPYRVEEWRPIDRLILAANPESWREGHPKIELVEVEEPSTRAAMMLAGEIDAARGVDWAQVAELQAAEGISVPLESSTTIYAVLLNHARPPFDDERARRRHGARPCRHHRRGDAGPCDGGRLHAACGAGVPRRRGRPPTTPRRRARSWRRWAPRARRSWSWSRRGPSSSPR